jgi:NADH dehydrogenase FAD-containing subunit
MTSRARVVVAGLGDTGRLVAGHLARSCDVVGITTKPEMLSGQEVGTRVTRPELWMRDNRIAFERLRRLDGVHILHGSLTSVDLDRRMAHVRTVDGEQRTEPYDVLVIATGVANGFWRRPHVQTHDEISRDLAAAHDRLAAANSIAVIGGGAAAVSTAANAAARWPSTDVALYYPHERPLLGHHRKVWGHLERRLEELGVRLHPGHRAVIPDDFDGDDITSATIEFSTGQPAAAADAVVWATGRVRPNTAGLPAELVDDDGFVVVGPTLQNPTRPEVFAVGDVAATDPLRGSARNRADRLVADNVRGHLSGRHAEDLKRYRPTRSRWGSVLGIQPDGIWFFDASGRLIRFPAWSVDRILIGWFLYRNTYGGVRRARADARPGPDADLARGSRG